MSSQTTPATPLLGSRRGWSRRAFLSSLGIVVAGQSVLRGQMPGIPGKATPTAGLDASPEVISQQTLGYMACGPCTLAYALSNGDAASRRAFAALDGGTPPGRVETLIRRFGGKPSETYQGHRPRWSGEGGLCSEDLPFMANEFFASANLPKVVGEWLDIRPPEDGPAHLRRVHGIFSAALASGLPAVVSVRSFGANTTGTPKAPKWDGLGGHMMAVVGVEPAELPARVTGFVCRFADSITGQVIRGYAYAEMHRAFTATRAFAVRADGSEDWRWITGHPYILLQAPDLTLNSDQRLWYERTFFTLSHAVHRGAAA